MKRNKLSIKTDDWKTFDKNNPAIALSILYIKEKEICPSYISKIILNCEKKKNSFNDPKRRRKMLALSCIKKTICITKRNNLKHNGDFYFLNCLHSSKTENKIISHEKVCKNKAFCGIVMSSEKE